MSAISLTATEQLQRLESGQLASVDLTQAYLDRIEEVDGQVGSFLKVDAEAALATAAKIDEQRASSKPELVRFLVPHALEPFGELLNLGWRAPGPTALLARVRLELGFRQVYDGSKLRHELVAFPFGQEQMVLGQGRLER